MHSAREFRKQFLYIIIEKGLKYILVSLSYLQMTFSLGIFF